MHRRTLLALAAATLTTPALAQGFPDQPVRLIVPFPPGGPADLIARIVARVMGERLGRPMVIESRSGAGGLVGVEAVVRARPDGHTIVLASSGALTVQPHLQGAAMPFDVQRDLAPIGLVLSVPQIMAVSPQVAARDVAALVALARAQPGRMTYGSAGIGSSLHMAGELFRQRAGIEITHVPFRGAAPAVTELLAGRIDILLADVPALLAHVRGGAVRALSVTSRARLALLPEVPTMAEAGVPGMVSETWYGLLAPAGTPAERIAVLNRALAEALADAETRRALADQGGTVEGGSPEQFAAHIRANSGTWAEVIRAGNIRPE
ncbi:MAG TPA: tripartite tricarboxylate transporter substrate binding protein [Acetobacteraceae bacterium]|nr:tripartite tricarboxylate transporter substrate binding protein [Acetobacteraceae bacterium]